MPSTGSPATSTASTLPIAIAAMFHADRAWGLLWLPDLHSPPGHCKPCRQDRGNMVRHGTGCWYEGWPAKLRRLAHDLGCHGMVTLAFGLTPSSACSTKIVGCCLVLLNGLWSGARSDDSNAHQHLPGAMVPGAQLSMAHAAAAACFASDSRKHADGLACRQLYPGSTCIIGRPSLICQGNPERQQAAQSLVSWWTQDRSGL